MEMNLNKVNQMWLYNHIISNILELEEKIANIVHEDLDVTSLEDLNVTSLERDFFVKHIIFYDFLHDYLSDIVVDEPYRAECEWLFATQYKSVSIDRFQTKQIVNKLIVNSLKEIAPTFFEHDLVLLNPQGNRSKHCKCRIYGFKNTKTLISRQFQYCASKELKNLHFLYEVLVQKKFLCRNEVLIQKELLYGDKLSNIHSKTLTFLPFTDGAYIFLEDLTYKEIDEIVEDTNKLILPYSFVLEEVDVHEKSINIEILQLIETFLCLHE